MQDYEKERRTISCCWIDIVTYNTSPNVVSVGFRDCGNPNQQVICWALLSFYVDRFKSLPFTRYHLSLQAHWVRKPYIYDTQKSLPFSSQELKVNRQRLKNGDPDSTFVYSDIFWRSPSLLIPWKIFRCTLSYQR